MKKILIFHPALAPYRKDFFNALGNAYDLNVVFLLRNNKNQGFRQDLLLKDATYAYEYLDHTFTLFNHRVNWGYLSKIRQTKPEIIITSEFGFSTIIVYLYKKILRKKYKIFTICDDSEDMIINMEGIRRRLRRFFAKRLSGIICVNPKVAHTYKSWGNKCACVFPIIRNEEQYYQGLDEIRNLSKEYITNWKLANKINILFVGRIAKVKNISGLLKVFSKLPEKIKNIANIIIVGDGSEKQDIILEANRLNIHNNIVLPGKYEGNHLLAWYNVGSFFILPSIFEPFGAVTGEALLSGCPTLISNKAGSSWLIDSTNGRLFNPLSETDFISNLTIMIENSKPTPTDGYFRSNLLSQNFSNYLSNLINNLNDDEK